MIKRPFPSLFVDHSDEIELHSFPLGGEPRFQGSQRPGGEGGAVTEGGCWSLNSMRSDKRLGELGSGRTQREQGHRGDTASPTEQGLVHASGFS